MTDERPRPLPKGLSLPEYALIDVAHVDDRFAADRLGGGDFDIAEPSVRIETQLRSFLACFRDFARARIVGREGKQNPIHLKIGAKIVRHGRYITFQLAEVAIPRSLFANILRLIDGLRPAPLPP